MASFFNQIVLTSLIALPVWAQNAEPSPAFKLTTGLYQYSGAASQNGLASDVNLRHSSGAGNVWLGYYSSVAHDLSQTRFGWDRSFELDWLRLQPSLQLSTGGAWNGSMSVETGSDWFVGAGLGRTNLRDSISLNFDPNDAYTLSGGYRWPNNKALSLVLVRDNRLHPDQQHVHLVYRTALPDKHRLTIDVLLKNGLVEGVPIQRTGLSVAYDWPRWFVRLTYDPKANFTPQDLWRLALGTRF